MTVDEPQVEATGDVLGGADGVARRERAQGVHAAALQERLVGIDAGMARYADEHIFGEVWGRPGLSHDDRMLVAITALAATGHLHLLRNYLHGALQSGIEPVKVHEALVMLHVYVGFPPSVSALWEWRQVLSSSVERGVVSAESAARCGGLDPNS
jgi:4-carboxymuconolactone decarboxylase